MSDPYIGEIQAFAFDFCPKGWLPCDGRVITVAGNTSLYALIGNYYSGGNGTTTFALPNLVNSASMSQGQGPGLSSYVVGQAVGTDQVILTIDELPRHTHPFRLGPVNAAGAVATPTMGSVVVDPGFNGYVSPPGDTTMATEFIAKAGRSEPHPNMQPTLTMIYCIATEGTYPVFG